MPLVNMVCMPVRQGQQKWCINVHARRNSPNLAAQTFLSLRFGKYVDPSETRTKPFKHLLPLYKGTLV